MLHGTWVHKQANTTRTAHIAQVQTHTDNERVKSELDLLLLQNWKWQPPQLSKLGKEITCRSEYESGHVENCVITSLFTCNVNFCNTVVCPLQLSWWNYFFMHILQYKINVSIILFKSWKMYVCNPPLVSNVMDFLMCWNLQLALPQKLVF
jgi:hypothetical protein